MKGVMQRQKALMLVLDEMNRRGIKSRTFLEKTLFLLKKEENIDSMIKFYSFFPYNYGPFSFTSYDDLNKLKKYGFITDELKLTERGKLAAGSIRKEISPKIFNIMTRFDSDSAIINYVYSRYPEYAVKSKIKLAKKTKHSPGIFTIGYESRDIDAFLDTLTKNRIDAVIDIRHNPFSMNFSFIQGNLKRKLKKVGIDYIHIKSLGVEGELRKNLNSPEDYKRLFEDYRKRVLEKNPEEISRIIGMGKEKRIALLCFEKDSEMCHRGVVSEELEKQGVKVTHL